MKCIHDVKEKTRGKNHNSGEITSVHKDELETTTLLLTHYQTTKFQAGPN